MTDDPVAWCLETVGGDGCPLLQEAYEKIRELEKENQRLKEALADIATLYSREPR